MNLKRDDLKNIWTPFEGHNNNTTLLHHKCKMALLRHIVLLCATWSYTNFTKSLNVIFKHDRVNPMKAQQKFERGKRLRLGKNVVIIMRVFSCKVYLPLLIYMHCLIISCSCMPITI